MEFPVVRDKESAVKKFKNKCKENIRSLFQRQICQSLSNSMFSSSGLTQLFFWTTLFIYMIAYVSTKHMNVRPHVYNKMYITN